MLAERYQWTPQEVDALDPDYYTELTAYIAASNRIEEKQRRKQGK